MLSRQRQFTTITTRAETHGPYSAADVEQILGGPFVSSPLSVVPKAGGKLRLGQDCSHEDGNGVSVNSMIDADMFPTTWGTAAQVAEKVSPSFQWPSSPRRWPGRAERDVYISLLNGGACSARGARDCPARGAMNGFRARREARYNDPCEVRGDARAAR